MRLFLTLGSRLWQQTVEFSWEFTCITGGIKADVYNSWESYMIIQPTWSLKTFLRYTYLCTAVKALSIKVLTARKIVGEKEDKSLILYFSTTRMRHYLEEEKRDRVLFLFKKRKSTLFRQFLYKACSTPKVLKRRQVFCSVKQAKVMGDFVKTLL